MMTLPEFQFFFTTLWSRKLFWCGAKYPSARKKFCTLNYSFIILDAIYWYENMCLIWEYKAPITQYVEVMKEKDGIAKEL
jgi:hypothetical protein